MIVTEILFEDHGQDFIQWVLDENGKVLNSAPFKNWLWRDGFVALESIKLGEQLIFYKPESAAIPIKYPVVSIRHALVTDEFSKQLYRQPPKKH